MRRASQPSQQELVTVNFIRNHYDKKYKSHIPFAIKLLTMKFAERIIGCNFLTIKQDLDFYQKIKNELPFTVKQFNLKFKASEHQFSAEKFHQICDNNFIPFPNISIIKSTHNTIFGGFTTLSWNSDERPYTYKGYQDQYAFLFMITSDDETLQNDCPLIFHQKKKDSPSSFSVCYDKSSGPVFGDHGWDCHVGNKCDKQVELAKYEILNSWLERESWEYLIDWRNTNIKHRSVSWSSLRSYHNKDHKNVISLCGGQRKCDLRNLDDVHLLDINIEYHLFDVEEYEVFELLK